MSMSEEVRASAKARVQFPNNVSVVVRAGGENNQVTIARRGKDMRWHFPNSNAALLFLLTNFGLHELDLAIVDDGGNIV